MGTSSKRWELHGFDGLDFAFADFGSPLPNLISVSPAVDSENFKGPTAQRLQDQRWTSLFKETRRGPDPEGVEANGCRVHARACKLNDLPKLLERCAG
eukprot:SAG31_NODE_3409_length_4306_cov_1.917281_1_plen_98_part_00